MGLVESGTQVFIISSRDLAKLYKNEIDLKLWILRDTSSAILKALKLNYRKHMHTRTYCDWK